ncbi:MAG TPA: hypothetical protein DCY53_06970 [Desulfobacteraceae bacterium]|nr:hypothetical protein [Desulfobacteraceae bacterium]
MIYVVNESITFGLPDIGDRILLHTDDRLDLPAGVPHHAVVSNKEIVRILFAVLFICYYPLAFDADIYAWTTDWVTKIHDI